MTQQTAHAQFNVKNQEPKSEEAADLKVLSEGLDEEDVAMTEEDRANFGEHEEGANV
ncbi:hypothetical protein PAXRUDRAFT_17492 [Paxillus rubicundulus Ve08.2h10]|uniref:Uncharacterized protein n=1 Tax=Paxillus rubicundulus Ve08.2h10 TaxID=930991 RepID=A0A0D0DHH0_9AGAM|nr:hypothetical protein PAXRUDRAFT_17492 [Paxillus rubicundulus Ve08.2h10]